jgi:hypothetical protein
MVRKKYSKELKARIALDAIKGKKTIAELASEYGVHANQISIWKKQFEVDPKSRTVFAHELRCTLVCFSLYNSCCLPGNFSSPINLSRRFSYQRLMWSLKIVKLKILLNS